MRYYKFTLCNDQDSVIAMTTWVEHLVYIWQVRTYKMYITYICNSITTSKDCLSVFITSSKSSVASHFIWYMCRSALKLSLSFSNCCIFWAASCVRAVADDPSSSLPTFGIMKVDASICQQYIKHDMITK